MHNRHESLRELGLLEYGINIAVKIPLDAYVSKWVYGENLHPSVQQLDKEVLIHSALILGIPVRRIKENDKIHAQIFLLNGTRREVRKKFLIEEEDFVDTHSILIFSPDIEIIRMPKKSNITDSIRPKEVAEYDLPLRIGGSTYADLSMLLPTRFSKAGKLIISRWGDNVMYDILPPSVK